jgi:hypothetical protein
MADFLPILRWLDPQGIRRKTQFHVARAFEIAGGFIKERTESTQKENSRDDKRKDYLDVLLEFRGDGVEEPSRFSSTTINAIVLVSSISFPMVLFSVLSLHTFLCFCSEAAKPVLI